MKRITTVRGDMKPEELGVTSIHEHALSKLFDEYDPEAIFESSKKYWGLPDDGGYQVPKREQLEISLENLGFLRSGWGMLCGVHTFYDDYGSFVRELQYFREAGGNSLCEATPCGMHSGFMEDIRKASEATGVNIIACTGIYVAHLQPEELAAKSVSELAAYFLNEVEHGIDGTDIKPGFTKCGLQTILPEGDVHPLELKGLRSASQAAAETGMALEVHIIGLHEEHVMQVCDIVLDEYGLAPEKVLICHQDLGIFDSCSISEHVRDFDRTSRLQLETQLKVLDKGINISYDNWGSVTMSPFEVLDIYNPTDLDKLRALDILLQKGYESQIMLGHDSIGRLNGVCGGGYGYTRVLGFVIPMLEKLGYSKSTVNKMLIDNPADFLAY